MSMKDIELLSDLMDQKFKIFGFRFGLDGLIGLIPVAGDILTSGVSFYIVVRAFMMGFPLFVVLRMLVNVFIDYLVGAVPLLGNLFDFIWKANTANVKLMKSYGQDPARTKARSGAVVLAFVFGLVALFVFLAVIVIKIIALLLGLLF